MEWSLIVERNLVDKSTVSAVKTPGSKSNCRAKSHRSPKLSSLLAYGRQGLLATVEVKYLRVSVSGFMGCMSDSEG